MRLARGLARYRGQKFPFSFQALNCLLDDKYWCYLRILNAVYGLFQS
jgi:hypothetical protein